MHGDPHDPQYEFLTFGNFFFLFLAMLENSVSPMGLDSSHATLNMIEVTSLLHHREKH